MTLVPSRIGFKDEHYSTYFSRHRMDSAFVDPNMKHIASRDHALDSYLILQCELLNSHVHQSWQPPMVVSFNTEASLKSSDGRLRKPLERMREMCVEERVADTGTSDGVLSGQEKISVGFSSDKNTSVCDVFDQQGLHDDLGELTKV